MFSTAPFDWYFVPCSDSSIDLLRAIAYNNDSSFWVQHSLGCGKGINSSQFGKLGRKLMHTFLYPGNTVAIDTIRYFYGRIWVDIDTSDMEFSDTGVLTTTIAGKEYHIGRRFYSGNELIEIEPLYLDVRKEYLLPYYKRQWDGPHWLTENEKLH